MINKHTILGRVGKNPEVRTLENGTKTCSFTIATSESYKDRNSGEKKEITDWHNIILWRGLADIAEQYIKKGSLVYIEGKSQTRSYEDKDGVTRYTTEIVGREMKMVGGSNSSSTSQSSDAPSDDIPF